MTGGEIKIFFGVLVCMGVYRASSQEDYWSSDETKPTHSIASDISQLRYQQLKRFLKICNPVGENDSIFSFNKLDPLLSHVRSTY